jgi:hypothetical protein
MKRTEPTATALCLLIYDNVDAILGRKDLWFFLPDNLKKPLKVFGNGKLEK